MTVEFLTRPSEAGRGCGYRDEEMPYLCTGLAGNGMPMEYFLLDPVQQYEDVWQRGYALVQIDQIYHAVIFVSDETYPSPWDFFAEAKNLGVSRKVPKSFPFHMLHPWASKMFFVHKKAWPKFPYQAKTHVYRPGYSEHMARYHYCKWRPSKGQLFDEKLPAEPLQDWWTHFETPTGYHPPTGFATGSTEPCAYALKALSFFVHAAKPGPDNYKIEFNGEQFWVVGPSHNYSDYIPRTDVDNEEIEWSPGVFMATFISHVEYAGKADEESAEAAKDAGFDVAVVNW